MLGLNTSIEQALNIVPAISNKMVEAIDDWTRMYEDKAEWLQEPTYNDPTRVVSLGLPAFIASEKARIAVLELKSDIKAPTVMVEKANPNYFEPYSDAMTGNMVTSGQPKTIIEAEVQGTTDRATYLNDQYQTKLLSRIRTQLEYGVAKGSLIIKPYVVKSKVQAVAGIDESEVEADDKYEMDFDFIQADCFYPFAFDGNGKLSEVAFLQTKTDKDTVYTRLEYHKLEGNKVTITNRCYESLGTNENPANGASLGREVELSKVPEWKDIPKFATVQNVDRLLFGYFKMPEANTIDPHSPLGISGFARAKSLIKDADMQYSRLLWEYEGGELAIDVDRDALRTVTDEKGQQHTIRAQMQQRLFRFVDINVNGETYQPFAPNLRDASLINGLNVILMRIEDVVGLSRGTIAEVTNEARTATELKMLKQRTYSSNAEIQKALEYALTDAVYAMNVYCTLYNIVGDVEKGSDGKIDAKKIGQYDISFTWDDSILVDVDTELNKRLTLMNNGLTSQREVRMWYFGEDERQAQSALDKIREEKQVAIEQNMVASSQMGKNIRDQNGQGEESNKEKPQDVDTQQQKPQNVVENTKK